MKYLKIEGLTNEEIKVAEIIDKHFKECENDSNYTFIHKTEVSDLSMIDKKLWNSIIDLIPVRINT